MSDETRESQTGFESADAGSRTPWIEATRIADVAHARAGDKGDTLNVS
jgi:hypothetical protein